MLAAGVFFWQVVLAVHVAAVVVAFGVTFAYPLIALAAMKMEPRAIIFFHRLQQFLGRRLVSPGLLVVLLAGIYLAGHFHQWGQFYVQWGIGVAIVLGGIEGAFMIPTAGKLADLAERDLGAGEGKPSDEYLALRNRVAAAGAVMSGLVLITVYVMTVNAVT